MRVKFSRDSNQNKRGVGCGETSLRFTFFLFLFSVQVIFCLAEKNPGKGSKSSIHICGPHRQWKIWIAIWNWFGFLPAVNFIVPLQVLLVWQF